MAVVAVVAVAVVVVVEVTGRRRRRWRDRSRRPFPPSRPFRIPTRSSIKVPRSEARPEPYTHQAWLLLLNHPQVRRRDKGSIWFYMASLTYNGVVRLHYGPKRKK